MDAYRVAFNTWQEKTEWVQKDKRFDVLLPWGKHRADVLKEYIDHLEAKCAALAAENAALKQFPEQIIGFIGKLGTSEMGSGTRETIESAAKRIKTPSTDSFLAEVLAQHSESICASLLEKAGEYEARAKEVDCHTTDNRYRFAAAMFRGFAAQLLQEAE